MRIADLHTHTILCKHASGTPEEFLSAALVRGESWFGVSDHCPWPEGYDSGSRMNVSEFPLYRENVKRLQRKAEGTPLKVLYAIEMDYVPGKMDDVEANLEKEEFDYIIGSIHYIEDFAFDNPDLLDEWKKPGTAEHVWDVYLKYLKEYVASWDFQILGHPDLPKKFGFRPVESESFLQRFTEIFEMAASRGIALELNTAGLHVPVREIYPSKTLLSLAKRAGMKITYGSDAHAPEAVGRDFAAAEQLAKECGFSGFVTFEKRRPIDLPFS